jgi:hypothetical protein
MISRPGQSTVENFLSSLQSADWRGECPRLDSRKMSPQLASNTGFIKIHTQRRVALRPLSCASVPTTWISCYKTVNSVLILATVGQSGMHSQNLRFISQIVTLKKYLAVTAPTVILSCKCAVHVTAGYISYQYHVRTQRGSLRDLYSALCQRTTILYGTQWYRNTKVTYRDFTEYGVLVPVTIQVVTPVLVPLTIQNATMCHVLFYFVLAYSYFLKYRCVCIILVSSCNYLNCSVMQFLQVLLWNFQVPSWLGVLIPTLVLFSQWGRCTARKSVVPMFCTVCSTCTRSGLGFIHRSRFLACFRCVLNSIHTQHHSPE